MVDKECGMCDIDSLVCVEGYYVLSTGSSFAGVQCMFENTVGPKVLWTKRAGQNQGSAKMSVGLETQKVR